MRRRTWQRFSDAVIATLDAYHAERPDLQGLGQEKLRLSLHPRLPTAPFAAAVQRLVADGAVVLDRAWLRRPQHEVRMTPEEEGIWTRAQPLLGDAHRFRPPRVRDVAHEFGIDEKIVRRVFRLAARRGEVDEIALDHFFLADTVAEMAEIAIDVARQAEDGRFNAAEFRDRLDNGRKVAIQILEYLRPPGLHHAARRLAADQSQPHWHVHPARGSRAGRDRRRCVPGGASGLQIREGSRDGPWWVQLPLSSASSTEGAAMTALAHHSRHARSGRARCRGRRDGVPPGGGRAHKGARARAKSRLPAAQSAAPDRGSRGARGERGDGGCRQPGHSSRQARLVE